MARHHVQDTAALFACFSRLLLPGGQIARADLDREDGSFHPPEAEGVYHTGFERAALRERLVKSGFVEIQCETAHTVHKAEKSYPVFLLTAVLGTETGYSEELNGV
jgi:putative AdoMet-dependent methyltransferase